MKTNNKWTLAVVLGALYGSCCLPASAVLIYDNSVNDPQIRLNINNLTVGDELNLAGTDRQLTHFSFEYWVEGGNVTLNTKLYLNDGALFNGYATPGTLFYDGGSIVVGPTSRSTLNFYEGIDWAPGGLVIPTDTLTLVVAISGVDQGELAGVDIYDPPVVGSSKRDYWFWTGSAWELREIANVNVNFASRFEAGVPDATGIEIPLMSGLGLLVASIFFKRRVVA